MKFSLITLIGTLLVLTSCVQKPPLTSFNSGNLRDDAMKNIGIIPFKNDQVSQSEQIIQGLSQEKRFFNVVNTEKLAKIIMEKNLNEPEVINLISNSTDLDIKKIEAILSGSIISLEKSENDHHLIKTDYKSCLNYETIKNGKKTCSKYKTYKVSCKKFKYEIKTNIKITKVSDDSLIYGKTYQAFSSNTHCENDNKPLPSSNESYIKLAKIVSEKLINDIAPSYVYFEAEPLAKPIVKNNANQEKILKKILRKPDIPYTDIQTKTFKNTLELLDKNRVLEANQFLGVLNLSLKGQSSVVLYNLALTEELLGDVKKAHQLFQKVEAIQKTKGNLKKQNKKDNQKTN
ncbi:MAG: hypothetical protein OIF32_04355 [Campylobacterales bacterium]|nr:hypothetical protein [Campylobacterales bacterium]